MIAHFFSCSTKSNIISITTVKIFLYILPKLGIQRGNFF